MCIRDRYYANEYAVTLQLSDKMGSLERKQANTKMFGYRTVQCLEKQVTWLLGFETVIRGLKNRSFTHSTVLTNQTQGTFDWKNYL